MNYYDSAIVFIVMNYWRFYWTQFGSIMGVFFKLAFDQRIWKHLKGISEKETFTLFYKKSS